MALAVASGPARRPAPGAALLAGLAALLALAMLAALCAGRYGIEPVHALQLLGRAVVDPLAPADTIEARIVLLVRLPRVLLAAAAGAGLAVCGAALQGVLRNPLVGPQVLGISSGAAFGGALAILLGLWGPVLLAQAFAGGLLALFLVGLVARIDGRTEVVTVILAGMVVAAMFGALVSLLQLVADPNSSLPAIVYWLMGSFASATWQRLALAVPGLLIGVAVLVALRFRLNLLSLDEAEARSLGAHPDRERWLVFLLVSLVVGSQVAVAGIVGWVGLVVPHAARLLVGHDHRHLVPASALVGAAFMVMVDTLARTITATEIPLGALTALVGAPVFAVLLRRHRREGARP